MWQKEYPEMPLGSLSLSGPVVGAPSADNLKIRPEFFPGLGIILAEDRDCHIVHLPFTSVESNQVYFNLMNLTAELDKKSRKSGFSYVRVY